jgi:hypothetical protein
VEAGLPGWFPETTPNQDSPLNHMLSRFLDSNFKNNRRVNVSALVKKIRSGESIPVGSLVLMASGDRRIRFKILEQSAIHKGFSEPLVLNEFAAEHKVTTNYLHWYLTRDEVVKCLVENARGAVFLRVPRKVLHAIPVPLPTTITRIKAEVEFSPVKTDNPFSNVINDLYRDYQLNLVNQRYRTASVLAGAICEVILYQLLVESGVNQKLLKDDRGLGMNKMLDYVRVLKLEQAPGFPLSQLEEIRKNRNEAVHAGLLIHKKRELTRESLDAFNPVVKYFGL